VDPNGLLLIIIVLGAFYLLVVRPARNRQKAQQATVSQVAPGARVMTTAGLFGTVTAVEDDQMDLEIAPGVTVRYVTAAVARIVETPDGGSAGIDAPGPAGTPEEPDASQTVDDTPDS
jgi:preprotein translocase subunit YajC